MQLTPSKFTKNLQYKYLNISISGVYSLDTSSITSPFSSFSVGNDPPKNLYQPKTKLTPLVCTNMVSLVNSLMSHEKLSICHVADINIFVLIYIFLKFFMFL